MTMPHPYWPSPSEHALLHAIFRGDSEARDAWRRWRALDRLDRMEQAEHRLLPLLVRERSELLVDDEALGRLRGVHRRAWIDAQLRLRSAAPALRALADRGIRAVLLKGAALAAQAYADPGCRPMADVDLLVPESRADDAVRALRSVGYESLVPDAPGRRFRRTHALPLARRDEPHAALDLHARPMDRLTPARFDRDLLARARPIEVAGAPAFVPDPADHLLVIACHGVAPNTVGPVRWAADAAMLVRRFRAELDWPRMLQDAHACRLDWTLAQVLRFVAEELGAAVPREVLQRLDAARPSWTERLERPRRRRAHALGADLASLLTPWMRLAVRGADGWRFLPAVAMETPLRAAWFAWKHAVLRPGRERSAAHAHPHAQ